MILCLAAGCSATPASHNASDVQDQSDVPAVPDVVATPDVPDTAAPLPEVLDPTQYCELGVAVFCDFYLRCGRMAVPDVAACEVTFVEACNARFEPTYVALAEAGLLTLSRAAMDACQAHLATVECDQQIFDLDGPCRDVWQGQQVQGGACGPGIESFVCVEGTACVLGLDFCGTCELAVPTGGACEPGVRCGPSDACRDGICVPRPGVGEVCDGTIPCILGAACGTDGLCAGDEWVTVGALCDQDRKCPYKSVCSGGACVETVLVGGACTSSAGCASGECSEGECVPFSDSSVSLACTGSQ